MLKIRLLRVGKRNQPFYKIVVTDKKNPPQGGRFKEQVGTLDPVNNNQNLKEDRIKYWLSVGAQPSKRINNLLIEEGLMEGEKKDVRPERSLVTGLENKEKEESEEEKKEEEKEKEKESENNKNDNSEEEDDDNDDSEEKKEEEEEESDKKESSSKEKDD